jgi:hypothetical protein
MATRVQFRRWAGLFPIYNPPPEKMKRAKATSFTKDASGMDVNKSEIVFAIRHPLTLLYGIKNVIVEDIESPQPETGGLFEVTLNCVEFKTPAKVNVITVANQGNALFPGSSPTGPPAAPSSKKIQP